MKKFISLLLSLTAVLGLMTACGEGSQAATTESAKTIIGTWKYDGAMDCAYVFQANGQGAYRYYGVDIPFTYTDDGTAVSIQYENSAAPLVLKYTINGDILSIEDSFGEMVTYKWAGNASATQGTPDSGETSPALQTYYEWWAGEWYGWWCMHDATGEFEFLNNQAWDAYAIIEEKDGSGHIRIWDTILRTEGTLASCDVHFEPGGSERGKMVSTNGRFFATEDWVYNDLVPTIAPIGEGQWQVDPTVSSVSHFENMLEISGTYVDPENSSNSFCYSIFLRPWGTRWDDVKSGDTTGCIYKDMMPVYYDQWYIPLLDKGAFLMPSSFAEGIAMVESEF